MSNLDFFNCIVYFIIVNKALYCCEKFAENLEGQISFNKRNMNFQQENMIINFS